MLNKANDCLVKLCTQLGFKAHLADSGQAPLGPDLAWQTFLHTNACYAVE